jgi:hypothetical protein
MASLAVIPLLVTSMALAQDDPPAEAGRLSWISGTVSIQPVGTQDWGQAYPNLTIGPGDRIFTDSDGRAEIQVGQTYVRIGPNTDVSLVDDSQFAINFGVAQGSIRVHTFGLWPRQLLDVSTPNGNAEFERSGELRVDVYPQDGAAVFTNLGQFADITGAGQFRQDLGYRQSLQLSGTNPVYPQWLQPAQLDDLDGWSQQRDQQIARAASYQYVSPDIPGAGDLDAYGDWEPQTEYGAIWYPRGVPADWEPYHYGHWVNHDPWGWVWVEDEPWGYAPFHYGRWVSYRGRWGWIPGPVAVRPVYSPALVVFAAGVQFGGVGVSAWFPLGPGEAYRPWYRCSPRYIDQVNITNIRESSRVHVQNTYVNVVNVTNVTYINQTRGITAMRHEDFVAGRSGRNAAVRVDTREIEHVRAVDRPQLPPPTQQSFITHPVARPVRVSAQRPTVINQQGQFIAARPGATPVQPPVRPAGPTKALPGRTVIAAPAPPSGRPNSPAQSREERNPNQPPPTYPGSQQPRPNPVQPGMRPEAPVDGRQDMRPNQPNQPAQQNQPERPSLPNQPSPTYPGGQPPRPHPIPPVQPEMRPNAPPDRTQDPRTNQPAQENQPSRPAQPTQGYPGSQSRPPASEPPARPEPRPVPPNANQQDRTPNWPGQNRPSAQPVPPGDNRQELGPTQRDRSGEDRQSQPQARPESPRSSPPAAQQAPPPAERQARPAPPPSSRQEYGPPQQGRPNNQHEQPNRNDNKNQQKNDKNDEKRPHD